MKLKKAMKKYDIKVTNLQNPHYRIGERVIFRSSSSGNLWWGDSAGIHQFSESEAVSWLTAGATPLSPMERACKKWPIKAIGIYNPVYELGERSVFLSEGLNPGKWMKATKGGETFTESEAVAYLLEGYKSGVSEPIVGKFNFGKGDFTVDFFAKKPEPKLFSMISMLNTSGRTIHTGDVLTKNEVTNEWHKCPICGKYHRL